MQTLELFQNTPTETLLAHTGALLDEARVVISILSERQSTDRSEPSLPVPAPDVPLVPQSSELGRRETEIAVGDPLAFSAYKKLQDAVDEQLGPEIRFLNDFISHVGGSPSTVAKTLARQDYARRILNGDSRYENGHWKWCGRNPVPPTLDERSVLADKFEAAAKKLDLIRYKVRFGEANPVVLNRLAEYRLLAKGGACGRWMCNGLAQELLKISNRIR